MGDGQKKGQWTVGLSTTPEKTLIASGREVPCQVEFQTMRGQGKTVHGVQASESVRNT